MLCELLSMAATSQAKQTDNGEVSPVTYTYMILTLLLYIGHVVPHQQTMLDVNWVQAMTLILIFRQ